MRSRGLKKEGQLAVIVSPNFLWGTRQARAREAILKHAFLLAVISLPPNVFAHSSIPSAILILNRSRDGKTYMVRVSTSFTTRDDKGGKVIYVGKGKNLNRRVFADHLGGDLKISTSTFRRSVNRVYGISPGQPLKEWVRSNCSFAFVAIPDPDLCSAVEALTVLVLRQQGCKLFNA